MKTERFVSPIPPGVRDRIDRAMSRPEHRMLPGSHEQRGGPECRCGADWDRWNDLCTAEADR